MTASLTLIILHYNTPQLVKSLLESIEKYANLSVPQLEILIVDNHSSEQNVKLLKEHVAKTTLPVRVFYNSENVGFAVGNNIALKEVKTEYVMLLNSDTEFMSQTDLSAMLHYMNENKKVAVLTPKLQLSDGTLDWASHRGEPTPWASFTYFSKLEKIFPHTKLFGQYHQTYKNLHEVHEVDACSGAAMLVRKTAMDQVGLLDERFFMYAEDLDWCKRFRDTGYSVVYFPQSVIIHHKYQSGRQHTAQKLRKKTNTYFYDTMLQYYDKHYQKVYPFYIRWCVKIFIQLKKGVV